MDKDTALSVVRSIVFLIRERIKTKADDPNHDDNPHAFLARKLADDFPWCRSYLLPGYAESKIIEKLLCEATTYAIATEEKDFLHITVRTDDACGVFCFSKHANNYFCIGFTEPPQDHSPPA
jgi:hypothetical protein